MANADKAVGRIRRYKIIFTPQKVRPAVLQLVLLCIIVLISSFWLLVWFSSTPVMQCWKSRVSMKVKSYHEIDFIYDNQQLLLIYFVDQCWLKFSFPTDVTTDEWEFYLLPLDDDVISLELPEFFRDSFLVGSVFVICHYHIAIPTTGSNLCSYKFCDIYFPSLTHLS